ncbi:CdaR family protein [Jeotgalibacillus proteolyticus]|uniref:CdaR family protein n=1 Tax=Jeotgalibacillus proteolyticus TaxID=2082395 RepID=UPI003CF40183
MDKFLESRWFLRGFALLMAAIMFATVNSPDDQQNENPNPQSTTEVIENVPVDTIYNQDSLVVTGVPSSVNVSISGPAQIVAATRGLRNYRVFVNLSEEEIGTHEVQIQYEGFSQQLDVTLSEPYAEVTIDERVTEEFTVDTEFSDTIIPDGYELEEVTVSPETVVVTGAKNIIDAIRYVRATINVDGEVDGEETVQSTVQVLNADLDKLPVSIEPATVDVDISVNQPSREVSIVPVQTGTLSDGLEVDELTLSNDTVTIFGPTDVIDAIEEIEVPFDLTGIEESGSRIEVPIPIPDGVGELSDPSAAAIVTFTTDPEEADENNEPVSEEPVQPSDEPEETPEDAPEEAPDDPADENNESDENASTESDTEKEEELTLSALPVEVRGSGDDLQAAFQNPPSGELNLRVTGESDEVEALTEEDVTLYVDAAELEEGEHEVEVQVEGPPEMVYVLSQSNVTIQLSQA